MSRKATKNSSKDNFKVKEEINEITEEEENSLPEKIKQENEASFEINLDEIEGKSTNNKTRTRKFTNFR